MTRDPGPSERVTPERAQALLDIHGGDPARWPAAERAALEAWTSRDPDGILALAEARALDEMLSDDAAAFAQDDTPPDDLRARILADAAAETMAAPGGSAVADGPAPRPGIGAMLGSVLGGVLGGVIGRRAMPVLTASAVAGLLLGFVMGPVGGLPAEDTGDAYAQETAALMIMAFDPSLAFGGGLQEWDENRDD